MIYGRVELHFSQIQMFIFSSYFNYSSFYEHEYHVMANDNIKILNELIFFQFKLFVYWSRFSEIHLKVGTFGCN